MEKRFLREACVLQEYRWMFLTHPLFFLCAQIMGYFYSEKEFAGLGSV